MTLEFDLVSLKPIKQNNIIDIAMIFLCSKFLYNIIFCFLDEYIIKLFFSSGNLIIMKSQILLTIIFNLRCSYAKKDLILKKD